MLEPEQADSPIPDPELLLTDAIKTEENDSPNLFEPPALQSAESGTDMCIEEPRSIPAFESYFIPSVHIKSEIYEDEEESAAYVENTFDRTPDNNLVDLTAEDLPRTDLPLDVDTDEENEQHMDAFSCQGSSDVTTSTNFEHPFMCQLCLKIYSSSSCLRRHQRIAHETDKDYSRFISVDSDGHPTCQVCQKSFSEVDNLQRHIAIAHRRLLESSASPESEQSEGEDSLECDECGEHFQLRQALQKHVAMMHCRLLTEENISNDKKEYTCDVCQKSFSEFINLRRHITLAHKKATANDATSTQEKSKVVSKSVNSKKNNTCDICHKLFIKNVNLRRHVILVHSNKSSEEATVNTKVQFSCELCEKSYSTLPQLRRHVTLAHSENTAYTDTQFSCELCGKSYSTLSHLRRHMAINHAESSDEATAHSETPEAANTEIQQFTCGVCEKSYSTLSQLRRHMTLAHTEKTSQFSCELCEKSYSTLSHLRRHIKINHAKSKDKTTTAHSKKSEAENTEVQFSCDLCEKSYSTLSQLRRHVTLAHVEKTVYAGIQFSCELCEKFYSTLSHLRRHMAINHVEGEGDATAHSKTPEAASTEVEFTCEVCEKSYSTLSQLRRHVTINHADIKDDEATAMDDSKGTCELCDKFYSNLRRHMREVHGGTAEGSDKPNSEQQSGSKKPLKCDLCGEKFGLSAALLLHKRTYHAEIPVARPHECSECGKAFYTPRDLERHKMHQHSGPRQCTICMATFSSVSSLKNHMYQTHMNTKLIKPHTSNLKPSLIAAPPVGNPPADNDIPIDKDKSPTIKKPLAVPKSVITSIVKAARPPTQNWDNILVPFSVSRDPKLRACPVVVLQDLASMKNPPIVLRSLLAGTPEPSSNQSSAENQPEQSDPPDLVSQPEPLTPSKAQVKKIPCRFCGGYLRSDGIPKHEVHVHKKWWCRFCVVYFDSPTHECSHVPNSVIPCPYCPQTYTFKNQLLLHLAEHTNKVAPEPPAAEPTENPSEPPISCPHCPETYNHESQFLLHLAEHKEKNVEPVIKPAADTTPEPPVSCPFCPKMFSFKNISLLHASLHKDNQPELAADPAQSSEELSISCPLCPKLINKKNVYLLHMDLHKGKKVGLKPVKTSAALSNVKSRETRLKIKKKSLLKSQTVNCEKNTPEVVKIAANKEAEYKCEYCNKVFKYVAKKAIVWHMMRCSGGKMRNCHGFNHKCKKCWRRFESKKKLSNHHMIVHNVKEYKKFKCSWCSERFGVKGGLRRHERWVHAGATARGLQCAVCEERFPAKQALRRHLAQGHLGLHPCGDCGRIFTREQGLSSHSCGVDLVQSSAPPSLGTSNSEPAVGSAISELAGSSSELASGPLKYTKQSCPHCHGVFLTTKSFESHKVPSSKKCDICSIILNSRCELLLHNYQNQHLNQQFPCRICHTKFDTHALRREHTLSHWRLFCPVCSTTHPSTYGKKLKLNCNKCNNKLLRQCIHCEYGFKSRESWYAHVGSNTSKVVCVKRCPLCPKTFDVLACLKNHLEMHHPGVSSALVARPAALSALPIYFCAHCSEPSPWQHGWKEQQLCLKCGTLSKPKLHCDLGGTHTINIGHEFLHLHYECPFCSEKFSYKICLLRHLACYHEKFRFTAVDHFLPEGSDFACRKCRTSCSTIQEFLFHSITAHSPSEVSCSVCQSPMDPPPTEQEVHCAKCDQRVNLSVKCVRCQQGFSTGEFVKHFLTKGCCRYKKPDETSTLENRQCDLTVQKTCLNHYRCPECDLSFLDSQQLQSHITTAHSHHGRLYKCALCEAVFSKRMQIYEHISQTHLTDSHFYKLQSITIQENGEAIPTLENLPPSTPSDGYSELPLTGVMVFDDQGHELDLEAEVKPPQTEEYTMNSLPRVEIELGAETNRCKLVSVKGSQASVKPLNHELQLAVAVQAINQSAENSSYFPDASINEVPPASEVSVASPEVENVRDPDSSGPSELTMGGESMEQVAADVEMSFSEEGLNQQDLLTQTRFEATSSLPVEPASRAPAEPKPKMIPTKSNRSRYRDRPRPFACNKCDKAFISESYLLRHETLVHTAHPAIFKCFHCDKRYGLKNALCMHIYFNHLGQKYQCVPCGMPFGQKRQLVKHNAAVHASNPKRCSECNIELQNLFLLKDHMQQVHHHNSYKYECDSCNTTFNTKRSLRSHITGTHGLDARPRSCPICMKTLKNTFFLKIHFSNKHKNAPPDIIKQAPHLEPYQYHQYKRGDPSVPHSHFCNQCAKSYTSQPTLKLHIFRAHGEGSKPQTCTHCGKKLKNSYTLRLHLRKKHLDLFLSSHNKNNSKSNKSKSSEKQDKSTSSEHVACPKCNILVKKSYMYVHLYYAHQGNASCPFCNKIIQNRRSFRRHIITSHGIPKNSKELQQLIAQGYKSKEDDLRELLKKFAPKRRKNKSENETPAEKKKLPLLLEQQDQAPIDRYECSVCKKRFKLLVTLRNHMRQIHTLLRK